MGGGGSIDPHSELARARAHDSHFLDANMMIALTVAWDSLSEAARQYTNNVSAGYYSSERAHDEALGVVEDCRKECLQVARSVAENFEVGRQFQLMDDLQDFIIDEFDEPKSPVLRYPEHRESVFRELARDVPDAMDRAQKQIASDFRKATEIIIVFRKQDHVTVWDRSPGDPTDVYPDTGDDLEEVMTNTDDLKILLDARHCLDYGSPDELLMATMDRSDFVEDRDEIEAIVGSPEILDVLALAEIAGQESDTDT